jgi:hypothetical protein
MKVREGWYLPKVKKFVMNQVSLLYMIGTPRYLLYVECRMLLKLILLRRQAVNLMIPRMIMEWRKTMVMFSEAEGGLVSLKRLSDHAW